MARALRLSDAESGAAGSGEIDFARADGDMLTGYVAGGRARRPDMSRDRAIGQNVGRVTRPEQESVRRHGRCTEGQPSLRRARS